MHAYESLERASRGEVERREEGLVGWEGGGSSSSPKCCDDTLQGQGVPVKGKVGLYKSTATRKEAYGGIRKY